RAEQVIEDPFAAQHRRRASGIRGDRKDAAVAQEPRSLGAVLERDAAKAVAVHAGNPIVLRQTFIHEGVVGRQRLEDAAIAPNLTLEEQLGLASEGLAQVLVKVL